MRWPFLLLAPVVLAGCAGSSPVISRLPFEGPLITLDSTGPRHTVKMAAPSSGWSLRLDRGRRQFSSTEVFITITRPNPAYMHAQAQLVQHLDSTIDTREPVVVFARVFDFGRVDTKAPYRLAVSSGMPHRAAPSENPAGGR